VKYSTNWGRWKTSSRYAAHDVADSCAIISRHSCARRAATLAAPSPQDGQGQET
jgi:hypothetical protein